MFPVSRSPLPEWASGKSWMAINVYRLDLIRFPHSMKSLAVCGHGHDHDNGRRPGLCPFDFLNGATCPNVKAL